MARGHKSNAQDVIENPIVDTTRTSPVTSPSTSRRQSVDARPNAAIERIAERAKLKFEELLWSLEPSELRDIASAIEQDRPDGGSRKRRRILEVDAEITTRPRRGRTAESESLYETHEQGPVAEICIRCFRSWAKAIGSEEEIVDCITEKPRRKKCEACSLKRVSCEFIPYDGAKALQRLKTRWIHAPKDQAHDAYADFVREYWKLDDYIFHHPIPAEVDRKAKQRKLKQAQRRASNAQSGDGEEVLRGQALEDGEEDDLAVEAQLRQEAGGMV